MVGPASGRDIFIESLIDLSTTGMPIQRPHLSNADERLVPHTACHSQHPLSGIACPLPVHSFRASANADMFCLPHLFGIVLLGCIDGPRRALALPEPAMCSTMQSVAVGLDAHIPRWS